MTYHIRVSDEAEEDIANAWDWYYKIQPSLAEQFLLTVEFSFEKIKSSPYLFAKKHKNIRSASIKKFPFAVLYIVNGNDIEIFSVFHHKRNPKIWKQRKK